MAKKLFLAALILFIIGISGFFSVRASIIFLAEKKADAILAGIPDHNPTNTAIDAARYIFSHFGKDGYPNNPVLSILRPYWSSRHLPAIIRMPLGAMETVMNEGNCDDAARSLSFILQRRKIVSRQWNMLLPRLAHAALLVYDESPVLVDPFYGYATNRTVGVTDPYVIASAMKQGKPMEDFFVPFGAASDSRFYKEFEAVVMGPQNDPLLIPVTLPNIKPGSVIVLGKTDGDYVDIEHDSLRRGLTYVWTYIGHKFDRQWTREMIAKNKVKVEIILSRPPDEGIIATLSPRPVIDGTRLTWNLLPNEKIVSKDAAAKLSWRRLGSYIDIDQIIITPKADPPYRRDRQ